MDWRETHGSRENTQHSWKRMLWLSCCLCPHLVNTGIFPACINSERRFALLCASSTAVSWNYPKSGLFPGILLPWTQSYSKPGRPAPAKAWKPGSMGIESWKAGSSISQEKTDRAGSNRTQQILQEHLPALLQSQQSLLNIRHPQKTSLEIKKQTGLLLYTLNRGESLRSGNAMPEPGLVSLLSWQGRGRGGRKKSPLAALFFPPPPLEDCRRPILIKLIKPAPFKELQPHATRGEEKNMKLKVKKRSLHASTFLQSHPSPADP